MTDDKNLTYAYLAEFIDANGSITITKTKCSYKTKDGTKKGTTQYRVKLSAHNCKIAPIQLLQQTFGGGKLRNTRRGKVKLHPNWRACYEWTLTCVQATNALKAMLPYLKIKDEQARICIELDAFKKTYSPGQRRWDKEFNERCEQKFAAWKERCNVLNKRGN